MNDYLDIKNSVVPDNLNMKIYKSIIDEIRKTQQSINAVIKQLNDLKFSNEEPLPEFKDLDSFLDNAMD